MKDKTLLISVLAACGIHALALLINFNLSRNSLASTPPAIEVTLVAPTRSVTPAPGPACAPPAAPKPAPVLKKATTPKVKKESSRPIKPKVEPQPVRAPEPAPVPIPETTQPCIEPETVSEPVKEETVAVSTKPPVVESVVADADAGSGATEAVSRSAISDTDSRGTSSTGGSGSTGEGAYGSSIGGSMPAYAHNPKPEYPPTARRNGQEGRTLLLVEVLSNGRVGEVRIERSSGYELLDSTAVEAVRKWSFVPAKKGRSSVAAWVRIPIDFSLTE
jgi:protein TonB